MQRDFTYMFTTANNGEAIRIWKSADGYIFQTRHQKGNTMDNYSYFIEEAFTECASCGEPAPDNELVYAHGEFVHRTCPIYF